MAACTTTHTTAPGQTPNVTVSDITAPPQAATPTSAATQRPAPRSEAELLERDRLELESALRFRGDGQLSGSARLQLDRVAQLLNARPELLLIHIRVTRLCAGPRVALRDAVLSAQIRADAILQYLWRSRGISAERLEAVGSARSDCSAAQSAHDQQPPAWRTELWVQQRAKPHP